MPSDTFPEPLPRRLRTTLQDSLQPESMVGAALGATGGGLMTLIAASSWYGGALPERVVVPATENGAVFAHWTMDDETLWGDGQHVEPNCTWWNGSVSYTSDLCSHFSLSRMASNNAGRAIERAVKCAAQYETECVLSTEIGVSIPAAFVYDPKGSGMRMLIAPRILPQVDSTSPPDVRTVRVQDPEGQTSGRLVEFNYTVNIEYLPGGSRAPVSETINGSDAYCVQLLRAAFVEECWAQLD